MYIDALTMHGKQYFFFLYVLPKDLKLDFKYVSNKKEQIKKIETLLLKLLKLYSTFSSDTRNIEILNNFNGKNFIQLEAQFYLRKLNKLHGLLFNYHLNYKNQLICSDKIIGEPICELNIVESNPIKTYQFIKAPHQEDLTSYLYSCIDFLKTYRLNIFKENEPEMYCELVKIVNKINNLLLKITTVKKIKTHTIAQDKLKNFIDRYKNNTEIKKNKKIYYLVKSLFFTDLQEEVQMFISINLVKVFEKIIELRLSHYGNNLYIGKEDKKIIERNDKYKDEILNRNNFLLKSNNRQLMNQYPDFMIKEGDIFHILDAKYKFKEKLLNNSDDVRQVLIYSVLFNKNKIHNLSKVKKIIVYVVKSNIDMLNVDKIKIDDNPIKINVNNCDIFNENLFNSKIYFKPIKILM